MRSFTFRCLFCGSCSDSHIRGYILLHLIRTCNKLHPPLSDQSTYWMQISETSTYNINRSSVFYYKLAFQAYILIILNICARAPVRVCVCVCVCLIGLVTLKQLTPQNEIVIIYLPSYYYKSHMSLFMSVNRCNRCQSHLSLSFLWKYAINVSCGWAFRFV